MPKGAIVEPDEYHTTYFTPPVPSLFAGLGLTWAECFFYTMSKKRTAKPAPYVSYSEKLRDPRWQKMRLKIMERDKFKCQHCYSAEKTLNVHHAFYTKGAAPWEYEDSALLTLCEDCHGQVELRNRLILAATAASPHRQMRLLNYLSAMNGDGPWGDVSIVWLADAFHGILKGWEDIQCAKNGDGDISDALDALRRESLAALENIGVILKGASDAALEIPFPDPELK